MSEMEDLWGEYIWASRQEDLETVTWRTLNHDTAFVFDILKKVVKLLVKPTNDKLYI